MDATAAEIRVLGCLIEKQRTTPDQYPLTLNALRLACNQSTNRHPVVEYDEATVREAARRLSAREWARLASGQGSRAVKYRHLVDRALGLSEAELSLLSVLLLRGPQTPGELKQRSERLYSFASLDEAEQVLARLAERELVARLPRGPGQKEDRYVQLLGEPGEAPVTAAAATGRAPQRVVPTLLYEDTETAVAWLGRAFGARVAERTRGYVELELEGGGLVRVGQAPESATAGRASLLHALVEDVDAFRTRAEAAGAVPVEPFDDDGSSRRPRYACRDLGGHRWTFAAASSDG